MQQSKVYYKYLLFIVIFLLFSKPAAAEILGLAGANSSEDSTYAYIGAVIPVNSTLADDGFRVRLWGEYLEYDYDGNIGGIPTSFDADGFGGNFSVGYQWNLQQTRISAYAGIALRDMDISPPDPSSDTEDDDVGARFQLEINPQFTSNIDAALIGTYTAVFDSYWVRLRPGYLLPSGLKIGPEITVMGDDNFYKQKYGAFLSGIKLGNIRVGIDAGYEESDDDGSIYGGIALSTVF